MDLEITIKNMAQRAARSELRKQLDWRPGETLKQTLTQTVHKIVGGILEHQDDSSIFGHNQRLQGETMARAHRHGGRWSRNEDEAFKTGWTDGMVEMAIAHGRSLKAIKERYKHLRRGGWMPY